MYMFVCVSMHGSLFISFPSLAFVLSVVLLGVFHFLLIRLKMERKKWACRQRSPQNKSPPKIAFFTLILLCFGFQLRSFQNGFVRANILRSVRNGGFFFWLSFKKHRKIENKSEGMQECEMTISKMINLYYISMLRWNVCTIRGIHTKARTHA